MDENLFDRKLPFSLIAEQSLLGSILIDPECLNELAELVSPMISISPSTSRSIWRCASSTSPATPSTLSR
ncbi:MAG: hypothetical protein J6R04_03300 [Clostridia bacterium]|nr:hypothetical protein [Clostridia bacterium]